MGSEFKKDKEEFVNKVWGRIPSKARPVTLMVIVLIIPTYIFIKQFTAPHPSSSSELRTIQMEKNLQADNSKDKPVNLLKRSYAQASIKKEPLSVIQTQADVVFFKQIKVSAAHLDSFDACNFITSAYENSTHKITITQLSTIANQMDSFDTANMIAGLESNILNDDNAKALNTLLKRMDSFDARRALDVLVKAENGK
jgi:hypothetical protein